MGAKNKGSKSALAVVPFEKLFSKESSNIFVFETDRNGLHTTPSAKFALQHCGAMKGQGFGLWGNSFALPVLDTDLQLLPIYVINSFVSNFLEFSRINNSLKFYIFPIGQSLMGYKDIHIAPLFSGAQENCILPKNWIVQDHLINR